MLGGQQLDSRSRELECERQAVQSATDAQDCAGVALRQVEVGTRGAGAVEEERHRFRLAELAELEPVPRCRKTQWWNEERVLAANAQRLAAGGQNSERVGVGEKTRNGRRCLQHVLEVVEHEQGLPVAEGSTESLGDDVRRGVSDPEGPRGGG